MGSGWLTYMENTSFNNFIEDIWIRSLDCRDWIYKFESQKISHGWTENQVDELRNLFDKIVQDISARVMLLGANKSHPAKEIIFHKRYGWVLASSGLKAFLGKVIMPDKTPIEIGQQSYISGHATLRGQHRLGIGAYSAIAEGLYLNTSPDSHPTEYSSMINFSAEKRILDEGMAMDISYEPLARYEAGIDIGSDVWIGREVRIFHGVNISHGSVIAERSLVKKSTEPFGIYAGIPARLKRFRFDEKTVSTLLEIKWWDWPVDRILRNKKFFATNLKKFNGDLLSLIVN